MSGSQRFISSGHHKSTQALNARLTTLQLRMWKIHRCYFHLTLNLRNAGLGGWIAPCWSCKERRLSCGQADAWPWPGTATREFLHYEYEPWLCSACCQFEDLTTHLKKVWWEKCDTQMLLLPFLVAPHSWTHWTLHCPCLALAVPILLPVLPSSNCKMCKASNLKQINPFSTILSLPRLPNSPFFTSHRNRLPTKFPL